MTLASVLADRAGKIFIDDTLTPLGAAGNEFWELTPEDLLPLPPGSDLFFLPGRNALGINASTGKTEVLDEEETMPVAAILPQGYTRLLLPAYERRVHAPALPLFGYTAVAAIGEELYVAAVQTDEDNKWNPLYYSTPELKGMIEDRIGEAPKNRVLRHLAHCALTYHCLTAQNIFYQRWEGGIPTSPRCNAQCLGCISKQPAGCCPSPQGRIKFFPTVEEVVEIATAHLQTEEAIISFGQGCEGEPLLAGKTITQAIGKIRAKTAAGTININTNAGLPEALREMAEAGLDAARVSVFSADPESYRRYHRPQNYGLSQVAQSIDLMRAAGVVVSLNLLVFPGFTDLYSERDALFSFLYQHPVDMIQLRNLNIDPDFFHKALSPPASNYGKGRNGSRRQGIAGLIADLNSEFPRLLIGNFSKALR